MRRSGGECTGRTACAMTQKHKFMYTRVMVVRSAQYVVRSACCSSMFGWRGKDESPSTGVGASELDSLRRFASSVTFLAPIVSTNDSEPLLVLLPPPYFREITANAGGASETELRSKRYMRSTTPAVTQPHRLVDITDEPSLVERDTRHERLIGICSISHVVPLPLVAC